MAPSSMKLQGKGHVPLGAADGHHVVFQGLPQGLQGVVSELRQLVQKQYAPVGQGNLSRPGRPPAAHQARVGRGVVGRPEGPLPDEGLV